MDLSDYVNTFGQDLIRRYGERIHKITLNAGFSCPTRDGSKGIGGCTFCNNAAFNHHPVNPPAMQAQFEQGRHVIAQTTKAKRHIAYFQAYTNTYGEVAALRQLYDQALSEHNIVGLAVGTRPDCVTPEALDLLAEYQDKGYEVWLELGLQSALDETLARVQRGHGFADYVAAVKAAQARALPICTHLIFGLPGETPKHARITLDRVLEYGVAGLKLHPLHVVKHTILAKQWKNGEYQPWSQNDYVNTVAEVLEHTPADIRIHRVTATAGERILLAPHWCARKWPVINQLVHTFAERGTRQGVKSCVSPHPHV
jgi:radical SAM protein (TIGR01212 family)